VRLTLENYPRPPHGPLWSTRLLARAVGVSQSTVAQVWRSTGLRREHTGIFPAGTWHALLPRVRRVEAMIVAPPCALLAVEVFTGGSGSAPSPPAMFLDSIFRKPSLGSDDGSAYRSLDREQQRDHWQDLLLRVWDRAIAASEDDGPSLNRTAPREAVFLGLDRAREFIPESSGSHYIFGVDGASVAEARTDIASRLKRPRTGGRDYVGLLPNHMLWTHVVSAILVEFRIRARHLRPVNKLHTSATQFAQSGGPGGFVWPLSIKEAAVKARPRAVKGYFGYH
jgi:hypothetical protein